MASNGNSRILTVMKVYIGADHRGYELKEKVSHWLKNNSYEVVDLGADQIIPSDDYTIYAENVARRTNVESQARGILLCGSGHGVDIVANRFRGNRSIVGFNKQVVVQGREHENANILSLPAEWLDESEAVEIVKLFLETEFSGKQRYVRRNQAMSEIKE